MRLKIFLLINLLCWPCYAADNRGLFVTVLQEPQTLSSRVEISKLIDFSKQTGIKNLFIQVYRANRSWFPSRIADQSPYLECVKSCGSDPLRLLIDKAHQNDIKVYAWLNMLSLSENKNAPLLKKYGASILTTNRSAKNLLEEYKIDNQYFLEPGDPRVRQELAGVIDELVRAYPSLDGLLFDYIRYPDVHPDYGYTGENLKRFEEKTGIADPQAAMPQWQEWKRTQVTELLNELCWHARQIHPEISVAATGCAPYSRAYYEAFQDWPSWIKNKSVDFVAFMSYESDINEYRRSIEGARKETPDFGKVMLTVGAYKQLKTPKKFGRQLRACENAASRGCIIFHYGSLVDAPALAAEIKE